MKFDDKINDFLYTANEDVLNEFIEDRDLKFKVLQAKDSSSNLSKMIGAIMEGRGFKPGSEGFFLKRIEQAREMKKILDNVFDEAMNGVEQSIK